MHNWFDGNQLKWKVQYDFIYNIINTEMVICNVNVQYAMLLHRFLATLVFLVHNLATLN